MAQDLGAQASAVLGVLADLSPSAQQRSSALTVPTDWFHWLPASGVCLLTDWPTTELAVTVTIKRDLGERLAAIDRIRPGSRHSLRVGWLFVAGRRPFPDGRMQRILHPLVTVPVRVSIPPVVGDATLRPAGDVTFTELVADPELRHRLEQEREVGGGPLDGLRQAEIPHDLLDKLLRLRHFAKKAASAAGFEVTTVAPVSGPPDRLLRNDHLVVVAGVAVYTADEVGGLSAAESLRSWAGRDLSDAGAFHAMYLDGGNGGGEAAQSPAPASRVFTPFPLTPAQREAVAVSRVAAVSVVSGAAGTGKSHTVSAIASDAIAWGGTVLVAAKSEAAVDALLVLLAEAPGPDPVVFGSSERRDELARRLAAGTLRPADKDGLAEAERTARAVVAEADDLVASIARRLRTEQHLATDSGDEEEARRVAPGLFDPGCDLDEVAGLLSEARDESGWWDRRQAGRARTHLSRLCAGATEPDLDKLARTLDLARQARAAGDLRADGGLDLGEEWSRLERLEAHARRLAGQWLALASRSPEHLDRASLAAVAVLGTALRSGRASRRVQLARLDARLTRALPLWIGTLADVEDLLPPTPGLFDVVILDEASAIDQPLAAPALLRARRAVVVGDPHQLRHVSFLADDQLAEAAIAHRIEDPVLVGRLDVRRNSLFDVAVGVAPAIVLDEHFRSAPHLVDYVGRRLYGGALHVATRTPQTEDRDCIDVVRIGGRRDRGGVVQAEVRQVIGRLHDLRRQGARSVGVISPFRAQADALEAAVLEAFTVAELDALDLRVGTVHAFQGNERDVVLVSLGIGEGDAAATWRFVEDPHLFAVLATRARNRLVLLLSADPPEHGLLAGYLAHADTPPGRPAPAGVPSPWVASVAAGLVAAGIPAAPLYPTGRHAVDVCAGDARRFLGIECAVHPDGPTAHVQRHLALRRAGWELLDAFPSRWSDRRGELLVELTGRLLPAAEVR